MSQSWKITALASRPVIEAALVAHEDALDWDPDIVLSGSEVAEDRPEDWRLEAWLPRRPGRKELAALSALFAGGAPALDIEQLPETDWVTLSQENTRPIRAGRFHVHNSRPVRRSSAAAEFIPVTYITPSATMGETSVRAFGYW